ncbi:hypothetical protein G6321_00003300 (plasmid) [Bradyrhizobium barranii subsp. barranii]|uniref:Uncharacterized protein n=1 Tax=Bradyrhizobium barranii subsp. barranii TaxID=2823807 RepID=A0A7Z0QLW2_9BRAD|nr:hypothetical protein [Bradyrhizobium barranii]UGX89825.1 hypothetical protein G6321_00003300 [Bradyrhizobium barranii subsp. barranii]
MQNKRLGIRQRWQLTDKAIAKMRDAFRTSERAVKLDTYEDVENWCGAPEVGSIKDALYERLRPLLKMERSSGFDTHDLRAVAGAFLFEHVLDHNLPDRAAPLMTVLACLQANASVPAPGDPVWLEAVTIGRALVVLGAFLRYDPRHEAVAGSIRRLLTAGHKVSLRYGRPWMSPSDLAKATSKISELLAPLGLRNVFENVAAQMRTDGIYDFDQYLLGRRYQSTGRPPSFPYGFLVQLAAKLPDDPVMASEPAANWKEALSLARDLVAAIDIEPQNQFWTINLAPRRLDAQLREVGLYDHLFGLRQWSLRFAPFMLKHFFGATFDARLSRARGWTMADVVKLCEVVALKTRTDPARLTRADLKSTGLSDSQLDALLPHFIHSAGRVNSGYGTPLSAESSDLMFRPLVEGSNGSVVVPLASLAGPAFYEAAISAVRPILSKSEVTHLAGDGTERVILAMFKVAGLSPTVMGAKYNVGKSDEGECDLVFESDTHIVFVECKAKALTRAAMAGVSGAALEVYVGGVLNAQSQCLQQERLLRTKGLIDFEDGRHLDFRDREIVKLSVTLLDHGTLQDDKFFWALATTLRRSRKSKLKKVMSKINDELVKMDAIGRPARMSVLDAAFLSVGQLSTILVGVSDLAEFAKRINPRSTANSGNPLLEYHYQLNRRAP